MENNNKINANLIKIEIENCPQKSENDKIEKDLLIEDNKYNIQY